MANVIMNAGQKKQKGTVVPSPCALASGRRDEENVYSAAAAFGLTEI
jgi:hypothetical protein